MNYGKSIEMELTGITEVWGRTKDLSDFNLVHNYTIYIAKVCSEPTNILL
jgi:hypothetical protein